MSARQPGGDHDGSAAVNTRHFIKIIFALMIAAPVVRLLVRLCAWGLS